MTRRIRTVEVSAGNADFAAPVDPKRAGARKYKGGVIKRAPFTYKNGRKYEDPQNPGEARRKQQSNFFITVNTNKAVDTSTIARGSAALKSALEVLSHETCLAVCLKYGPKDFATYGDDQYADIITNVEWKAAVEVGPKLNRLHAHIWVTIDHYSQIQINGPMVGRIVAHSYNDALGPRSKDPLLITRGSPRVHIKLLPQSDFADIMKAYIHKGMATGS